MAALDHAAFRNSLGDPEPPADLTPPAKALWWLAKGKLKQGDDWEKAQAAQLLDDKALDAATDGEGQLRFTVAAQA